MISKSTDVRAGGAYVEIGGDDSGLEEKLKRAKKKLEAWGEEVKSLGLKMFGAGVGVFASLANSISFLSEYGDKIAKMSRRTGLSADMLYRLSHAANLAGTNLELVERGARGMNRALLQAAEGSSEIGTVFTALRINTTEFLAMSQDDRFLTLFDRLGKIADGGVRAGLAMKLLSRGGSELIPLFTAGSEAFAAAGREAEILGLVLGKDLTEGTEELNDWIYRAKSSFDGLRLAIAALYMPHAIKLLMWITSYTVAVKDYVNENPNVVHAVLQLAKTVTVLGAAFIGLGTLMTLAWTGALPWVGVIVLLLGIADALGIVDTGVAELSKNITINQHTLYGWGEALWGSFVAGAERLFGHLKGMMGDIMALLKTIAIYWKALWGEFDKHFWNDTLFGDSSVFKKDNWKTDAFDDAKKQAKAIWDERAKNFEDVENKFTKDTDAVGLKLFEDSQRANSLTDWSGKAKDIFDKLSGLTSSMPGVDTEAAPSMKIPKTGTVGFFGGMRPSEYLGGPTTIARQQLTELKQIDNSLRRIEKNTRNATPTYA